MGALDFGNFAAFEDAAKGFDAFVVEVRFAVAVFLGLSDCGRFEGRTGCEAGDCALSASVAASAAARSAARAGEGASGDELEVSDGVAAGGGGGALEMGVTGSAIHQNGVGIMPDVLRTVNAQSRCGGEAEEVLACCATRSGQRPQERKQWLDSRHHEASSGRIRKRNES